MPKVMIVLEAQTTEGLAKIKEFGRGVEDTVGKLKAANPALEAGRAFRTLAAPHRFRVIRDAEGWPVIPGKLGAIEYHDGRALAVYSNRPRLIARPWAVPAVRRWQVGDQEARGLFPPEALPAVAGLIRARRRRAGPRLTSEQALRLRAGARPSATLAA